MGYGSGSDGGCFWAWWRVAGGGISNAMFTRRDLCAEVLIARLRLAFAVGGGLHPPYGRICYLIIYSSLVIGRRWRGDAGASERHSHGDWERVEELAKSAEIGHTLAHFGTPAEAAIEHSQSHGALAFMAMEHGSAAAGQFFGP